MRWLFPVLWLALTGSWAGAAPVNLVTNSGFESGLRGWRPLWCRQAGAGTVTLEPQSARSGTHAARLEHRGPEDWSWEPELQVAVQPGDVFELEAWLRLEGPGEATLCASTWDAQGQSVNWRHGEKTLHAQKEWTRLRSRFVVPTGVSELRPRLIGQQPATVWVDDFSLVQQPGLGSLRAHTLPGQLQLSNAALALTVDTTNATLSVLDRRTGRHWRQQATHADLAVTAATATANHIELTLLHVPWGLPLQGRIELEPAKPEFTFQVSAQGEQPAPLRFPYPFASEPADRLIVPLNEGIGYPVEDPSVEPFRLIAYGGHGICMAFWGVTDGQAGQGVIIETPDDAALQMQRAAKRLVVAPEWDPQKGQFGYARRLRYVFFDQGGHVAIAKRYRAHAQQNGLLKTLTEKRRANPKVDLLVGAANIWNWDAEPVELVKEMQAAGIGRILWSRGGSPGALRALNELNVLTSRYDIYQDLMDPANFPLLRYTHPDWTTAGWPQDIILRADGSWAPGWAIEGKKEGWYYCGVLCDSRALEYAHERVPAELATHPYLCRFIDTTTATPWNECYSPKHPMTRTESRQWKMKLLEYMSRDSKLVAGSETGHDAAVPFVHYFEGMLSLGPYRVPDAGRAMQRIWEEPPPRVAQFQLGHTYRLPLWELVYHDCVVAQWYWGDYNNKLPSLWAKRDLFNVLYGTPPMFMFNGKLWAAQKERFVQSYRNTCPYARATGYAEMTDHRFLTPNRNVQQTAFANGVTITVNFGETPFRLSSGQMVQPMGLSVSGMPKD